jgi:hypothetical protein
MNYSLSLLLILAVPLLFSCKQGTESEPAARKISSFEGTYVGYRSRSIAQEKALDSIKVTLEVTRTGANQIQILQTSPNEFRYLVSIKGNLFSYDRGLTESECGASAITGEGYFREKELYLIETLSCTRQVAQSKSFIHLRAVKQL